MTHLEFVLIPYVSAGPIRFSMTPDDVARLLGPPDTLVPTTFGEPVRNEQRGNVGVRYDAAGSVAELGFAPGAPVVFDGARVFELDDPVAFFCARAEPQEILGFLVFLALGVTLSGYHDDDLSQRALCFFARGRFDRFAARMRPWTR